MRLRPTPRESIIITRTVQLTLLAPKRTKSLQVVCSLHSNTVHTLTHAASSSPSFMPRALSHTSTHTEKHIAPVNVIRTKSKLPPAAEEKAPRAADGRAPALCHWGAPPPPPQDATVCVLHPRTTRNAVRKNPLARCTY
jgi:hypothetical protein